MFSVGDHVIHPGQGLCTVIGFQDEPTPALVLQAGSGHGITRLLYPVAAAEKNLRPPVSRETALDVIGHFASMTCDDYTDRNSGLEEAHFKAMVKRGVPDSVRVTKTMHERISQAEQEHRKPSTYYARVLKEARRRSLEELACALGVDEDEVVRLFEEQGAPIPSAD